MKVTVYDEDGEVVAKDDIQAATWYQRTLELFPNDPKAGDISLLYADTLYDGGRTRDAAAELAADRQVFQAGDDVGAAVGRGGPDHQVAGPQRQAAAMHQQVAHGRPAGRRVGPSWQANHTLRRLCPVRLPKRTFTP